MSETSHSDPSSQNFWVQAFLAFRQLFLPSLIYCLVFVLLPLLFLSFGLGLLYAENALKIKEFATGHTGLVSPDFLKLLSLAGTAFYPVIASYLLAGLSMLVGFSCCLGLTQRYLKGFSYPSRTVLVRSAIKFTFRYLLWIVLLAMLILALVQTILPMMTFAVMPLVLAPALSLTHGWGVLRSLLRSFNMRWSDQAQFHFSIYVQACGFGAICYLLHLIGIGLFYYLSHLDQILSLPRWVIPGAPFSLQYALSCLVLSLAQTALVWMIAVASSCFVVFHNSHEFRRRLSKFT